jgi:hypothetical protein
VNLSEAGRDQKGHSAAPEVVRFNLFRFFFFGGAIYFNILILKALRKNELI